MHLTFVDNNGAIDKTTRTMIRRHAAKGQNLGRKINRLSRVEMLSRRAQPRVFAVACPDNASEDARKEMPKEERISRPVTAGLLPQVEPLIGDSISILNLPIQVAPEDRALMAEGKLMRLPYVNESIG